jgi:hypothetical protein
MAVAFLMVLSLARYLSILADRLIASRIVSESTTNVGSMSSD